jgi:hypothetical protein
MTPEELAPDGLPTDYTLHRVTMALGPDGALHARYVFHPLEYDQPWCHFNELIRQGYGWPDEPGLHVARVSVREPCLQYLMIDPNPDPQVRVDRWAVRPTP